MLILSFHLLRLLPFRFWLPFHLRLLLVQFILIVLGSYVALTFLVCTSKDRDRMDTETYVDHVKLIFDKPGRAGWCWIQLLGGLFWTWRWSLDCVNIQDLSYQVWQQRSWGFRSWILSSSWMLRCVTSRKSEDHNRTAAEAWNLDSVLVQRYFSLWRWGQYVISKRRDPGTHWHSVVFKQNEFCCRTWQLWAFECRPWNLFPVTKLKTNYETRDTWVVWKAEGRQQLRLVSVIWGSRRSINEIFTLLGRYAS